MTSKRLAEIRALILTVKQDSVVIGDTHIRTLVVEPDALVRALADLLEEVERLQQIVNDVWFIADRGAAEYIPAERWQELLESIARRTLENEGKSA